MTSLRDDDATFSTRFFFETGCFLFIAASERPAAGSAFLVSTGFRRQRFFRIGLAAGLHPHQFDLDGFDFLACTSGPPPFVQLGIVAATGVRRIVA